MTDRIGRDELFMSIARLVALRSTCTRKLVGAVIVRANRVVSMGYAGAPAGMPHCTDVGCKPGFGGGCTSTVHAEANAVAFAAREGIAVLGSVIYVTMSPCPECAKLIINAGITSVHYAESYRLTEGLVLLEQAGVEVVQHGP